MKLLELCNIVFFLLDEFESVLIEEVVFFILLEGSFRKFILFRLSGII